MYSLLYVCAGVILWIFITSFGLPPLPEELAVLTSGLFAHRLEKGDPLWQATGFEVPWLGQLGLLGIFGWLACIAGVIGTDIVLYFIGRFGGKRLLRRLISEERIAKASKQFDQHGIKALLLSRIFPMPGVRTGVFIAAGSIHYSLEKFILADIIAIPLVSFCYFAGYFGSSYIEQFLKTFHDSMHIIGIVIFLLSIPVIIYLYIRWKRRQQDKKKVTLEQLAAKQTVIGAIVEELLPHPHEAEKKTDSTSNDAVKVEPAKVETANPEASTRTESASK